MGLVQGFLDIGGAVAGDVRDGVGSAIGAAGGAVGGAVGSAVGAASGVLSSVEGAAAGIVRGAEAGAPTRVGYTIDTDQVPGLIARLTEAKAAIAQAGQVTWRHGHAKAPGGDGHSHAAAERMGGDLVDHHQRTNAAYQDVVQRMIDSLNQALAGYLATEHAAADGLNRQDV